MPVLSPKESEPIRPPLPGPNEYWEDSKWARDHFGDIVKEHPDLWVAIVDKKVVASGSTIEEVERAGKEETGRDEFPIYLAEKGLRVYKH
jgi:hypothetical protein